MSTDLTIAISIKVNDGLVFAADSASSIIINDPTGSSGVINVYDNANKVFNLHKQIPVGAITWGAGSIGLSSTTTLVKDFRELITTNPEHRIDPQSYTVEDIARKFYEYIYTEGYLIEFASWDPIRRPALGFIIGGYSTGAKMADVWKIDILEGGFCQGPQRIRQEDECGLDWNGVPDPISRIIMGYSPQFPQILSMAGIEPQKIAEVFQLANLHLQSPMIIPAMPIQDAIDIAYFLVDLTTKYVKYNPGPPTVGGPIEIATVTKHEGFKWITRKHYFDQKYNNN